MGQDDLKKAWRNAAAEIMACVKLVGVERMVRPPDPLPDHLLSPISRKKANEVPFGEIPEPEKGDDIEYGADQ